MYMRQFLAVSLLVASASISLHAAALDSTLFTTYTISTDLENVGLNVCGSTKQSRGCYWGGSLGPFGRVGAMMESSPSTNLTEQTVTRYIYVLDLGYGSKKDGVALYVYKKVDAISHSDDAVTVTLFKTISLPLTGGSTTVPRMAANGTVLLIGTNKDELLVLVKKNNLAVTESALGKISSITADQYGYITVNYGQSFVVFDPRRRD